MVKTIARVFKFTPQTIGALYFEESENDIESIYFWFLDSLEYIKEINKSGSQNF